MEITERDLTTSTLRFRVREAGVGPLVLLLHGYPDTAHTWDDLVLRLAEAGFHAVAPFMRGYPPSEIPADGDCGSLRLGEDALALADALEAERFTVIGHDWGASAAFTATALAPERIAALVAIAIPPVRAVKPGLAPLWALRHFFFYALPWLPERSLRAHGWQGLRHICRRWSPGWTIPDAEFAQLVTCFEAGGLGGALRYYRCFVRGLLSRDGRMAQRLLARRIGVPTLLLYGRDDVAAPFFAGDMSRAFAPGVRHEVVMLPDAGHFVQREQPEGTARAVLEFLRGPARS